MELVQQPLWSNSSSRLGAQQSAAQRRMRKVQEAIMSSGEAAAVAVRCGRGKGKAHENDSTRGAVR